MTKPTAGPRLALCLLSSLALTECGGSTPDPHPPKNPPVDASPEVSNDVSSDVGNQPGACDPCVPSEMTCSRKGPVTESTTFTVVSRTETGCSWQVQFAPTQYTLTCATLEICTDTGVCAQSSYGSDGGSWPTLSWSVGPETHVCYVKPS